MSSSTFEPTNEPTAHPTAPTAEPTFYPTTQYCDPNVASCCPMSPGHVTITPGVTSVPGGAFAGCTALTSVTLPDTLTEIADYAFVACTSLTSLVIPEGVVSIGFAALAIQNVPTLVIPSTVTILGDLALYSDQMTTLSLPNRFVTPVGLQYLTPVPCTYYPDTLLMTYNTMYNGSSPACIQPPTGTCTNRVTLNLSFPPQKVNVVLCLSAPAAVCTATAQCDIIGVYNTVDTTYSTNLLVPLPTPPPGTQATVYTPGDHPMFVNNMYPLDSAGLVYNSTSYGFTNIYSGGGSYFILNDYDYSITGGLGYNSAGVTKAPTSSNLPVPLSTGAIAGIVVGGVSFVSLALFALIYLISRRRAVTKMQTPEANLHPVVATATGIEAYYMPSSCELTSDLSTSKTYMLA